ncbi:hypothetical protein [Myroides injenensis]|uniref:hypothetical protein n=1 Tax=Myroides injenensis TaxID=1183151 RepID=UPI00028A2081|nr:hypothetical protein [Myroides injenensis]
MEKYERQIQEDANSNTKLIYSISSIVCSFFALFFCLIPFLNVISIFISIASLSLGIIGYKRISVLKPSKTLPAVAIIISLFPLVISIGINYVLIVYLMKWIG